MNKNLFTNDNNSNFIEILNANILYQDNFFLNSYLFNEKLIYKSIYIIFLLKNSRIKKTLKNF